VAGGAREEDRRGAASGWLPGRDRLVADLGAAAASVGETNAALPMIAELRASADVHFLVTTGAPVGGAGGKPSRPRRRASSCRSTRVSSPAFSITGSRTWRSSRERDLADLIVAPPTGRPAGTRKRACGALCKPMDEAAAVSRPPFNRFAVVLAQTRSCRAGFATWRRQAIAAGNLSRRAAAAVDAAALAGLRRHSATGRGDRCLDAWRRGGSGGRGASDPPATWPHFCTSSRRGIGARAR
jgi:hypothetical protein